ncbi:MAG: hypothetical protein ACO39X_06960 [Candidatus Nanopelagicaceae bacterium]
MRKFMENWHDPFIHEIQADELAALHEGPDEDEVDPFDAEDGEFIHDDDLPEDDDNSWNFTDSARENYEMQQYLRDCNRAYFGIKDI